MKREDLIIKIKDFPDTPGVYLMKNTAQEVLYVGKATSLRHRVLSYFQRPQEARIEMLLSQVSNIETKQTDSVIEALLLESRLIKLYQPKYNVKLKDDKTYLGILVTKEDWPRVLPSRITQKHPIGDFFGPFASGLQVREALKIIRRIFPFRTSCKPESNRACFEHHLGLCPGVCNGDISKTEYHQTILQIKKFLSGQKKSLARDLKTKMQQASKKQNYEKAAEYRNRLFALEHIQDVALIKQENHNYNYPAFHRIEAFDISNISGAFSVGSMVVFSEGIIDKNEYRKFKIKTVAGANDVASMREVLSRRFKHKEWPWPDLILIDGGKPQVAAAAQILENLNLEIPIVGIAKGPKRNKNEFIMEKNLKIDEQLLIRVRDEAHRFAIEYYRLLHRKNIISRKK